MDSMSTKPHAMHGDSPASPRWIQFWGKNVKANQAFCEPANKVLDDAKDFRKQMEGKVTIKEHQFAQFADAKALEDLLSDCLDAQKHRGETQRTPSMMKKVGKKTVVFANNFSSFLQAYSGIVEIMKGTDQQYGGLAYSTLSLLLIVAVNKQQKEDRIDSALLTLQREFARLELLRDIHSSDTMKRAIAEAYSLCIDFAQEVTLYYSRSTWRRVLEAITKPPQLGIDTKVAAITDAMTEIKMERATLDSKRLHQVQQSVDEVHARMDKVHRSVTSINGAVEALHLQNESRLLSTLKEKLLPGGYDTNAVFEEYSILVGESFRNTGRLTPLNIDRLMRNRSVKEWEENRKGCMLLLFGRTENTYTDYCWLSPAVFHLINLYRGQNRVVIFHCCHDRVFMESDTQAQAVLSSLVYQLLQAKAMILRDQPRYQELYRRFSDPMWRAFPLKMPFIVLGELLNEFPEVYMLLDRVDRIKGQADRFLDPLTDMMKKSKCVIKVFLVASSNNHADPNGKITSDVLRCAEDELGYDCFSGLRLDQR